MSQQYTPNLGFEPGDDARRDAVHIAVAPVVAAEELAPGRRVGLREDGLASGGEEPIGVVDPFREAPVLPGQLFWLFLFPGTITSLRHVWTHPAFRVKLPPALQGDR